MWRAGGALRRETLLRIADNGVNDSLGAEPGDDEEGGDGEDYDSEDDQNDDGDLPPSLRLYLQLLLGWNVLIGLWHGLITLPLQS